VEERWTYVCRWDDLTPGRGVAALIDGSQVAVFRLHHGGLHAVGNLDPHCGAYVMSRGITGSRGAAPTVASPLHKEVYDLRTGSCLTNPALSLPVYPVYQHHGLVFCSGGLDAGLDN
jgi:nitrite reductase (NADH) small subunit